MISFIVNWCLVSLNEYFNVFIYSFKKLKKYFFSKRGSLELDNKYSIYSDCLLLEEDLDEDKYLSYKLALTELGVDTSFLFWQDFYKKYFNLKTDLSLVKIPDYKDGYDKLLIIHKDLTLYRLFKVIRSLECQLECRCWSNMFYDSGYPDLLDRDILYHDRDPKYGNYAVRVHNHGISSYRKLSVFEKAYGPQSQSVYEMYPSGITLIEQLVLQLMHFDKNHNFYLLGTHQEVALCTGSRLKFASAVPKIRLNPCRILEISSTWYGCSFDGAYVFPVKSL